MELLKKFLLKSILLGVLVIQFQLDVSTGSISWQKKFMYLPQISYPFHTFTFLQRTFQHFMTTDMVVFYVIPLMESDYF